jgi:hypothetical protein
MTETIDDITISYYDNGIETVKELDKCVLTKGAWTTIVFQYQEWIPTRETYDEAKFAIRRYQKRNGQYWLKSKFTISSKEQAKKLIDILSNWMKED